MRKSQRIFTNPDNLNSLIKLRKKGYTLKSLGLMFNVDFTSIYHHVKGIVPSGHLIINLSDFISLSNPDVTDILSIFDIKLKDNLAYSDYIKRLNHRKYPNINRALNKI